MRGWIINGSGWPLQFLGAISIVVNIDCVINGPLPGDHMNVIIKISHYAGVIMGTIAYQITSLTIVYSTVYSDADQRKHRSFTSLAFVLGIHRGPVNWNIFHLMTSPCQHKHQTFIALAKLWNVLCLKTSSSMASHYCVPPYIEHRITVYGDALTLNKAKASAVTILTKNSDIFFL